MTTRRDVALITLGRAAATIGIALAALLFGCGGGGCPRASTTNPQPSESQPCPRGR